MGGFNPNGFTARGDISAPWDASVAEPPANTAPVVTPPVNQTIEFVFGTGGLPKNDTTLLAAIATASVADDNDVLSAVVDLSGLADPIPAGVHTIPFNATDLDGLPGSADWILTVAEAADITAPDFTAGTPLISEVTDSTFKVSVTVDEDCDCRHVVLFDGASPPTDDEVLAGTGNGGAAAVMVSTLHSAVADLEHIHQFSSLTGGTSYDVYVAAVDAAGNKRLSTVLSVTTLAGDTTPPEFTLLTTTESAEATLTFSISADEDVTYRVLVGTDSLSITSAIIMLGGLGIVNTVFDTGVLSATADEVVNVTTTGLLNDTQYYYYVAISDAAGNKIDVSQVPFILSPISTIDLAGTLLPKEHRVDFGQPFALIAGDTVEYDNLGYTVAILADGSITVDSDVTLPIVISWRVLDVTTATWGTSEDLTLEEFT